MRDQQDIERADHATDGAARARNLARRGEDDAEMSRPRDDRGPVKLHEIADVLRHDRSTLEDGKGEKVAIRATAGDAFARSDRIVAAIPQLASDLRGEMLVQQESHRKMARSRFAAACSRSAMAAWRSSRSSISRGNAA